MSITFQKRQKEMKRLDKQKEKAERRAQRKMEKRAEKEAGTDNPGLTPLDGTATDVTTEDTSIPQS